MCKPYRYDVNDLVQRFDANCFPFHVGVPCRMSFQLWRSLSYKLSPRHPYLFRQPPRNLLMLSSAIIFYRSALDKKIATRIEQALMSVVGLNAVAEDIRE